MLIRLLLLPAIYSLSTVSAAAVQLPFASSSDATSVHVEQQPDAQGPRDWPHSKLPWGEVNIISTTDTHGWLMGHQRHESSFSGDWGDLLSFVTRMKAEARRRGVDLLLVDSGDRVDGNGLVDAEPAGHVKGWTAMQYFQQMPYDVITTGNHELYKYPVAESVYHNLVQHYGERYVTSNVNITLTDSEGEQQEVIYGNRVRKFKTEMGRNVTAFGPLFDFKAHAAGISVQAPHLMVQEPWFLESIAEAPDFFLMVGHMSIQGQGDSEWSQIVRAIRKAHPTVPILIFGGHHHIRDCGREDSRSMSLASGRYMESVGWMSVKGLKEDSTQPLEFARRYLDQNRNTYAYHAGPEFDTIKGVAITRGLTETARSFNLTHKFGVAPQSYYLYRYPHTSPHSILNLFTTKVLPLLVSRPDRPYPSLTVLNTGSIRFDIFKGDFTSNDQWIILPFTNAFEYIRGVPRHTASKLLDYLNLVGEHHLLNSTVSRSFSSSSNLSPSSLLARDSAHLEHLHRRSTISSHSFFSSSSSRKTLHEGYVTIDGCGPPGSGDDTLHTPFPGYAQPIFVSTAFPPPPPSAHTVPEQEEDLIDIVFFDFIQPDVLDALNQLQKVKKFGEKDVGLYVSEVSANTIMEEYARREWN